jgi:hypothetical protein
MTQNQHPRGAAEPRDHRASGANLWGMKFWTVSWKGFGNFTQPADQPKPTGTGSAQVPSRVVSEFGDAISGISRVSGQAARSID